MKSICLSFAALLWASAAAAHPGHLAEVAGHGHWLGAAALGAAIALGAWQALKGKKAAQAQAADAEGETAGADEGEDWGDLEEAEAA